MIISQASGWPRTHRAAGANDTEAFAETRAILNAFYELAGEGAAVDLGCGDAHVTREWNMCTLIDLVPRQIPSRSMVVGDMRKFPKHCEESKQRFDLMVMLDSLEHLTANDGRQLIEGMEPHCKAMVIFTPVGPWNPEPLSTHPDTHKSSWYPERFWDAGFRVWEWPTYHRFPAGDIIGAFWAWRWRDGETPFPETVAEIAGVKI